MQQDATPPPDPETFLRIFRSSSPYIHAHRGKTLVVYLAGEALQSNHTALSHDLALLRSLGLRLVVVFGIRPQINATDSMSDRPSEFHQQLRVTDSTTLETVLQVAQAQLVRLQASLSNGLTNSPMYGSAVRTVTGNFVYARPRGIIDGVDLQYTGAVRRVQASDIRQQLDNNNIVLIPPFGYSLTGEVFNLSALELAHACARQLQADKLVMLNPAAALPDAGASGHLLPQELQQHLAALEPSTPGYYEAQTALDSCRAGVPRVHLLALDEPGAILRELYTRDGCGQMVTREDYDQFRQARSDDIAGILALLQPLEESGALVRRSREQLERDLGQFIVNDRDGTVIGCAALHLFPQDNNLHAELACVAVHPEYQAGGRGDSLLGYVERLAYQKGVRQLFVLSTQTVHWFQEHGFTPASVHDLPITRREMYNYQRNARVLVKSIVADTRGA